MPADGDPATAARDAEGRGLFEAGRAAFADGRYEDSLGYFDRAYALTHRAELLYNIGTANDRLRHDAEALAAFESYVRELPNAPNTREVEGRMRVLRASLAETSTTPSDAEPPTVSVEPEPQPPAVVATSAPAPSQPQHESDIGVAGEWWFWTLIGAVVVGGVVTAIVLGTQSSGTTYPPYMTGDNGAVVLTLTGAIP